jgi:hypothetical protein
VVTYTQEEHEQAHRAVEELFREVAARFSHATVRTDLPGPMGMPVILGLSCSLPGTAEIRARAGADQVDLYLGEAAWFELRPNRKRPGAIIETIRDAVDAVVAGRFEERIREARGQVIGSRSTVHLLSGKRMVTSGHNAGANVLFTGHRRTIRYEPFG